MATHKTIVVPTSPPLLNGQIPRWNSGTGLFEMYLPSDDLAGDLATASNKSALANLATAVLPAGTLAFVTTQLAYYQLDFAAVSGLDVPPLTIDAVDNSSRHWRRLPIGHSKWQNQAVWYIDGSAGNDEDDGSVGAPIKTLAEYNARLGGLFYVDMVVNCINLTSANLELIARPIQPPSGSSPRIRIKGDPGAATAGTVGTSTNSDPTTNAAPTLSNSTSLGLLFKLTGGASSGAVAWGANGSGAISEWVFDTGAPAAAPAASVNFNRYNPVAWHTLTHIHIDTGPEHLSDILGTEIVHTLVGTNVTQPTVTLENFIIQPSGTLIASTCLGFFGCHIKGMQQRAGRLFLIGCYAGPSNTFSIYGEGQVAFSLHGCLIASAAQLVVTSESRVIARNCLMMGTVVVARGRGYLELFRTGLFNSTSGVLLQENAYVYQSANFADEVLYGSGNTVGVAVSGGATLNLGGFALPKITGTTELVFDNAATAIPPIFPGATTIPTDIPMTTWAHLLGAGGTLVSYASGSKINR